MWQRFGDLMHEIPVVEEALRCHFKRRPEVVIGRVFTVTLPGVRLRLGEPARDQSDDA